jgi:hypothetical protein
MMEREQSEIIEIWKLKKKGAIQRHQHSRKGVCKGKNGGGGGGSTVTNDGYEPVH